MNHILEPEYPYTHNLIRFYLLDKAMFDFLGELIYYDTKRRGSGLDPE